MNYFNYGNSPAVKGPAVVPSRPTRLQLRTLRRRTMQKRRFHETAHLAVFHGGNEGLYYQGRKTR